MEQVQFCSMCIIISAVFCESVVYLILFLNIFQNLEQTKYGNKKLNNVLFTNSQKYLLSIKFLTIYILLYSLQYVLFNIKKSKFEICPIYNTSRRRHKDTVECIDTVSTFYIARQIQGKV